MASGCTHTHTHTYTLMGESDYKKPGAGWRAPGLKTFTSKTHQNLQDVFTTTYDWLCQLWPSFVDSLKFQRFDSLAHLRALIAISS